MTKFVVAFICTGNTCRSPMAEMILKHRLKQEGYDFVKVVSMGLDADDKQPITDKSRMALKNNKIPMTVFNSKRATVDKLRKCNVIICMTEAHKQRLVLFDNVYSCPQLVGHDIIDPYGKGIDIYDNTCTQLIKDMDSILDFLKIHFEQWRKNI